MKREPGNERQRAASKTAVENPDEKIVTEVSNPDPVLSAKQAAVGQALSDSHGQLRSYLQRRLGSSEEAVDVMQSFMLRALDRADALRDVATVRGWLSRILATSIADHQHGAARRRQREKNMSPQFLDAVPGGSDADLNAVVCACLRPLIATLKPEYAEVIDRIDLREEPREQVAASLGISLANLGVRLHRARQALKQRLVEMCLTCPEHGFLDCGCDTAKRVKLLREAAAKRSQL